MSVSKQTMKRRKLCFCVVSHNSDKLFCFGCFQFVGDVVHDSSAAAYGSEEDNSEIATKQARKRKIRFILLVVTATLVLLAIATCVPLLLGEFCEWVSCYHCKVLWDKNNNNMKQVSGWMKGENVSLFVSRDLSLFMWIGAGQFQWKSL